jgi:ATP-dependent DNA helicase RecG
MDGEQLILILEDRARLISADEIYSLEDKSWPKLIKEDHRVERKSCGIHARELSQWFSMWANTPPHGGLIAVGVGNSGVFDGILKCSVEHMNELERTGDNFCPDAKYDFKRTEIVNADGRPDQLLLIRVFYNGRKVVRNTDGSAFIRRGESKRRLSEQEIRELQIEKGELFWEREKSAQSYPVDFDEKLVALFADSVVAKLGLTESRGKEEILVLRHLGEMVHGKFVPNKACALLFSNDPVKEIRGCRIRFMRFDGKEEGVGERFNATKDLWIEGKIPDQLVQVESAISTQLREFSRLGEDGKFSTSPEYPKVAWFEAVVNAVCHRSYNLETIPVFIKMFDDRLEVISPGGFMPSVTPQTIYETHAPRNPDLMNALFFLDFVKCAHEGTRRMRATMKELELPDPDFSEYEESHLYVKVVLRNNVEQRKTWIDSDASNVVGELIFKTLTAHEKRVINHVAEYGKISVTDAVRLTDKAWETCKAMLEKLADRGILRHVHRDDLVRDPNAHYILNRDG